MNRYLTAAGVVAVAAVAAGCSSGASHGSAVSPPSTPGATAATATANAAATASRGAGRSGGPGSTASATPAATPSPVLFGMGAQTAAGRVRADGYKLLLSLSGAQIDADAKAHAGNTNEILGSAILAGLPGVPSRYLAGIALGGNTGLSKGEIVFQFTRQGQTAVEARVIAAGHKAGSHVIIDKNLVVTVVSGK